MTGFTQKYPELAKKCQVFGQLRNLIDLTIAAAFMQEHDYYGKVEWKAALLSSEDKFPVQTYQCAGRSGNGRDQPLEGQPFDDARGRRCEHASPASIGCDNLLSDEGGKVQQLHDQVDLKQLAEGQWWWD